MNKKNNKNNKRINRTKKNSKKLNRNRNRTKGYKLLKGGMAPSCVSSPDVKRYMAACHTANLHNTNPVADYGLIEGSGVLPPKQQGGSCYKPSEQSVPLTFTQYLERTSELIGGNSSNFDTTTLETDMAKSDGFPQQQQTGGSGFSINPEEMIGGLPGRAKYDSCCQPVIMGGKLVQGKDTQALCGHQMGGSKRNNNSRRRRTRKNNRKLKKSKNNKRKTHKQLRGGNPSKFPFKGETSNFDDKAEGKDFDGKQPYWTPETR